MASKSLDVICLGRAAVDFYGDQVGGRLEDMQSFAKYLGGSSANLAAGLARLGSRSAMLARVGDEQMGRFVREALAREGVDVSHVTTDPDRLTALVVLGIADRNSFPHIFFRENCADMATSADDVDEAFIASSRALSITGTHLSTEGTFAAVRKAVSFARAHDTRVILDIDYRPVLWGLTAAGSGEERYIESAAVTRRIQSMLGEFDILVGTEEEICIAGGSPDVYTSLLSVREQSAATIVLKRGALGCVVFDAEIPASIDDGIAVPGVQVEVLNTLGAGDAFLSGFLHAWLCNASWEECCRSGNACGALVVSRHGCTPAMPTRAELADYLDRSATITRPDKDVRIQYLHEATTRRTIPGPLFVLAFDHRRQLEEMVVSTDPPAGRISAFKSLVCDAVLRVADELPDDASLGVIVDERYGESVLARLSARQWWIGRPVEVPGSCPLELDPRNSMGVPLLHWPASHVVKCLVFYHPDDDIQLRLQQEERVRQLYADCRDLGRELLLEVIATSKGQQVNDSTIPNVMRRFYNLGVLPSWWKLESQTAAAWNEIGAVVNEFDPLCHGVLVLGLDAAEAEMKESFRIAAPNAVCKGFAVGRSIFGDVARQWFDNRLDDQSVIDRVAENYKTMIRFWQEAASGNTGSDEERATG